MGSTIYHNIIRFIVEHNVSFCNSEVVLHDEEVKTYYIKFLFSMLRRKGKKMIIEEFVALPQMSLLILHLLQKVTGERELILDLNCLKVQTALMKELGFDLDFISN